MGAEEKKGDHQIEKLWKKFWNYEKSSEIMKKVLKILKILNMKWKKSMKSKNIFYAECIGLADQIRPSMFWANVSKCALNSKSESNF